MATLREVLGLLARSSGGYSTRSSCLRRGLLLSRWGSITSTPTHCCCLSPAVQLPAGDRPYTSPAVDYIRPLSPAVRHLVDSHNINDLSSITATGPGQRLLKGYSYIIGPTKTNIRSCIHVRLYVHISSQYIVGPFQSSLSLKCRTCHD